MKIGLNLFFTILSYVGGTLLISFPSIYKHNTDEVAEELIVNKVLKSMIQARSRW